jgi:hypothetical protein
MEMGRRNEVKKKRGGREGSGRMRKDRRNRKIGR